MISQCLTALLRYRHDSGQVTGGGLVPVPIDFGAPLHQPLFYGPFASRKVLSPTAKRGGTKLQVLAPPIPYVAMLTAVQAQPMRRQTGRLAANGMVDPYLISTGPVKGLVSNDFRFIP